jgi:hypothetical protein
MSDILLEVKSHVALFSNTQIERQSTGLWVLFKKENNHVTAASIYRGCEQLQV